MGISVTIPANNVALFNPGSSGGIPVTGAYPGILKSLTAYKSKAGNDSIKAVFQINEAGNPYNGKEQWAFLGLDFGKDGNVRSWRAMLESVGVKSEKISAGFTIDLDLIIGKTSYLYLDVPEAGPDGKVDVNSINSSFITKAQFDTYRAQHGAPGASKPAGATATAMQTSAPVGGGFSLSSAAPAVTPAAAAPAASAPAATASDLF